MSNKLLVAASLLLLVVGMLRSNTVEDVFLRSATRDLAAVSANEQPKESLSTKYKELKFLFLATPRSHFLPKSHGRTYPFIVSPTGATVVTTSDSIYTSRCIASMLLNNGSDDDTSFDVIVLEFENSLYHTQKLIQRLSLRYPDAMILLLDMWLPTQYRHIPSGGMPMSEWAHHQHESGQHNGRHLHVQTVRQLVRDTTHVGEWEHERFYTVDQIRQIQQQHAVVVQAPRPSDVHSAMESKSFTHMNGAYSLQGHRFLSILILDTLQKRNFRTTHSSRSPQPWTVHDSCQRWHTNKKMFNSSIERHPKLELSNYQKATFALEARAKSTWIKVTNDEPKQPMALIFEYMSKSESCDYQRVELSIVEGGKGVVEAGCDSNKENRGRAHFIQQVHVGTVLPASEAKVQIDVIPDSGSIPFRIVGIMLVPIDTLEQEGSADIAVA